MRTLLALLLAGAATPALAQQSGAEAAPQTSCTPEHAAMGHCTMPSEAVDPHAGHTMSAEELKEQPAPDPHAGHQMSPEEEPADPHAGHQMPAEEQPAADPHAGHQMPAKPQAAEPATDPHAGHAMPAQPQAGQPAADPHAGHSMGANSTNPPVAPPPPEALQGPADAADLYWDRASMAQSREQLRREHGDMPVYKILVDQAEARIRKGRDGYFLNGEAWYGGDINKAWFKTEIEGEFGDRPEQAEVQALWSRAIDPWFDLQAGVRYDASPGRDTAHLVLGVQGLAPYWIEVDAAAFVSTRGDVTARVEAEHDVRLTQKLILQPRVEVDFALQDVPREALGSGLSTGEIGLRLRYQISQQFGPYIGLEYDRAFGTTRKFRRRDGEDLGGLSFVTGLRLWF